jgi:hypothetical protein
MRYVTTLVLFCFSILCVHSHGQSAMPTLNALQRTFMIQTTHGRGTVFSVDIDNREYWITAKHLFTGIKSGPQGEFSTKTVQVNILAPVGTGDTGEGQNWQTFTFTTIDPGMDIDILVLVPDHLLLNYHRDFNLNVGIEGMILGGDCTFLGFPYGGGWRSKWSVTGQWLWWPYIKHCTVSGKLGNPNITVHVLDGINNPGFSGGPVLFNTGAAQRVFAVISGYTTEPLKVLPASILDGAHASAVPTPPQLPGQDSTASSDEIVEANAGFILAYDIDPAIKAIRATPIGPLRPETPAPATAPVPTSPSHSK